MFTLSTSALCGILLVGGKNVQAGKMSHGELVSFGTYSFLLALGTVGVMKACGEYSKAMLSAVRLYKLLYFDDANNDDDTEDSTDTGRPAKASPTEHVPIEAAQVQSIAMEHVSFHYRNDTSKMILQNVSLRIQRGEVVALVGKNGAGRSCEIQLLHDTFGMMVLVVVFLSSFLV